jgi:hypothetical protein
MKQNRTVPLRSIADTTKHVSAPPARKLVDKPGEWPWSSWRFYFLNDSSLLPVDPIL